MAPTPNRCRRCARLRQAASGTLADHSLGQAPLAVVGMRAHRITSAIWFVDSGQARQKATCHLPPGWRSDAAHVSRPPGHPGHHRRPGGTTNVDTSRPLTLSYRASISNIRLDQLQLPGLSFPRIVQIPTKLKIHPEVGRNPKESRQAQCRAWGQSPVPIHYLVDPPVGHTYGLR